MPRSVNKLSVTSLAHSHKKKFFLGTGLLLAVAQADRASGPIDAEKSVLFAFSSLIPWPSLPRKTRSFFPKGGGQLLTVGAGWYINDSWSTANSGAATLVYGVIEPIGCSDLSIRFID